MAGIIQKAAGNQSISSVNTREVHNASDLTIGDFVTFKLHAPPLIKEKTFKVASINTYNFESSTDTEFVLQGATRAPIYMSVENNSDSVEIRLSVMLKLGFVRKLFDENELAEVVDNEDDLIEMHRLIDTDAIGSKLAEYAGWTAPLYYRQAFGVRGCRYKGDFRNAPVTQSGLSCDEFDYYCLVSSDERHVVEIAVYNYSENVMLTFVTDGEIIGELRKGS